MGGDKDNVPQKTKKSKTEKEPPKPLDKDEATIKRLKVSIYLIRMGSGDLVYSCQSALPVLCDCLWRPESLVTLSNYVPY
jgi:hypothetical protein